MQKLAPSGASVPHDGQRRSSGDPQLMQNFAAAGLSVEQAAQRVTTLAHCRICLSTRFPSMA
jgi:hypothetical protein